MEAMVLSAVPCIEILYLFYFSIFEINMNFVLGSSPIRFRYLSRDIYISLSLYLSISLSPYLSALFSHNKAREALVHTYEQASFETLLLPLHVAHHDPSSTHTHNEL